MDNLINNLGYLLNKAARLAKWELNNKLSEMGLTSPQFAVLRDVYCNQEKGEMLSTLTPASIAERLNSDRPTISGIIHRLTKQGWVQRVENPNDRRSQIIVLTYKSRQLMEKLESLSNDTMRRAVNDFTSEEIECFKSYLQRIINNFS